MSSKITVGKIVANATDAGWSQAYHAGGFTSVVSATKEGKTEEEKSLQEYGKKLLDTLVSEYFTLTTKDLDTIKSAVEATVAKLPTGIAVSLVVASVVKNILYIVIANQGRVLLKRGDKLGLLLEIKSDDEEKIASLSGFLENNDIVLLHTPSFAKIFPHDILVREFDNKSAEELSEVFAPKVHEAQDGSVSALVFSFHEEPQYAQEVIHETPKIESHDGSLKELQAKQKEHEEPEKKEEERKVEEHKQLPGFAPFETKQEIQPLQKSSVSHRQKLFLTIATIVCLVLIGSITVFLTKQNDAKQQALFQSLYTPAKAKFDDATGLLSLNKSLAISDLQDAQNRLQGATGKFAANSSYAKQITSLLSKINSSLSDAQKIPLLTTQQVANDVSPFLAFAAKHEGAYITEDSTNYYTADSTGVTQYSQKSPLTGKAIIKNTGAYTMIGGFDTYFGNFYVLDQKNGIIKFIPTSGSSYGNSAYLAKGASVDFSKAVSMSIDSDIWVLTSDGTIMKFTKGQQDSFTVSGLDKPFNSPTQISTSADLNNIYILDKGNERVVVLKKDGTFVAEYATDTARTASLIAVSEKNKKLYFLSNNTIYSLNLN